MKHHTRFALLGLSLAIMMILVLMGGCSYHNAAPESEAPAEPKVLIYSLDELPVHTYPIKGTVSELLDDSDALAELRVLYRADLEADLKKYDIDDSSTLQGMYGKLATLNVLDGRTDEALKLMDEVAALEDKEATRLTSGMTTRALIAAKNSLSGNYTEQELHNAFARELGTYVSTLPYDIVQDQIKSAKGRAEYLSENLLRGVVQSQLDPAVAATGELAADQAFTAISMRYAIDEVLPLNPVVADIYSRYLKANAVEKDNIWPDREFTFMDKMMRPDVVVGIWDSGVDAAVFDNNMYVNEAEKFDGTDTDGNGFVDDVHGIAFDLDGVASSEMLHPLGDQDGKLGKVFGYMQGFTDLTSAIDSKAASDVRAEMANMPAENVATS